MVAPPPSLADIADELEELDSPLDRLTWLVELGKSLPPFPEPERVEANRVLGCQSMVWLIARPASGNGQRLEFVADSDAPMVRGLIAILLAAYSGRSPQEILALPIEEHFERMQLRSFITPLRSNGLYSMVQRIRDLAAAEEQPSARISAPAATPSSAAPPPASLPPLDVEAIRGDFPILARRLEGDLPLIYLDNAATTQRPRQVIQTLADVDQRCYSNVHRGGHALAAETTQRFEAARRAAARLLNARRPHEVLFTSGTTAGINLVARAWGDANVRAGDEILLTEMEHHSNIVPWQQLAERTGCAIRWVPVRDDFLLDLEAFDRLLSPRVKLVAVAHVSNALGTINPVAEIVRRARAAGAATLVDAAQSAPHEPLDVQALGCDFLAFSGHKMLGPSGVGVLYGREEMLEAMPPFLGGGSMIHRVTTDGFQPASLPHKFEAGTPPIAQAIGLGAAIAYLEGVGLDRVLAHEQALVRRAHERLADVPGLRFFGPAPEHKAGIVTFTIDGLHAEEIARALDAQGVAVRAGHHCTMPLHARFGLPASCRASFYLYNTLAEVDALAAGVREACRVFGR